MLNRRPSDASNPPRCHVRGTQTSLQVVGPASAGLRAVAARKELAAQCEPVIRETNFAMNSGRSTSCSTSTEGPSIHGRADES